LLTHVNEETVIRASQQFWEQMLAMHLEHVPADSRIFVGAGHLRASVSLMGMCTGRIEVRLAERLAYAATAAMLLQPLHQIAEADTLDAAREIANMIAGTIKASLPRPCTMTLPESSVETDGFCGLPLTRHALAVAFRHEAGDLMVRVQAREDGE